MSRKNTKYNNDLKESIYNDYLRGLSYTSLSDKYELHINIITSILNTEKVRHLYINEYIKKLQLVDRDCERLIINGCTSEQIYDYFCTVKPQLKLSKKLVYNKVLTIKKQLNGF